MQSAKRFVRGAVSAPSVLRDLRGLVGPFGVYMGDGTLLVHTVHGMKYFVPADDDIMTPELVIHRHWEPELSAYLAGLVHRDTVFVDVGANFGYFSCLLASRIGPEGQGKVIAVEPNPRLADLLRRNLVANWSMAKIELLTIAATNMSGRRHFTVPKRRGVNGSLTPTADEEADVFEVECDRLDDRLGPTCRVDVMKVDVEGHELGVLEGARSILSNNPGITLVVEWSVAQMRDAQVDPARLTSFLMELGFEYRLAESGNAIDGNSLLSIPYGNLIAQRPTNR